MGKCRAALIAVGFSDDTMRDFTPAALPHGAVEKITDF
ncbi:hypothetical protein HMPREF0860_2439 [Treponema socranskii subsp. socranskii VPI DR56BR1116 = ATCC 35536]|uniref:Uncharacterized protein n=1 Tax=Treponema socranskii subsp. socranskii VPI DR56BR1116 = ATCC 35536 TaxID=1125725 RepID=U2N017_TRESO|nr:hypothetical protein HMPREF1325_0637 [Treponema socranskii subsp. socranskii VPI DR56BR1116 = ATCC 35536]ERK04794.1 hypothetical protein HMPREF0860_2439 [Treponema socranskii subsp. socranskii VPI DR56BR1116 = ATCC 35536]